LKSTGGVLSCDGVIGVERLELMKAFAVSWRSSSLPKD
jgi:hypothetical protein